MKYKKLQLVYKNRILTLKFNKYEKNKITHYKEHNSYDFEGTRVLTEIDFNSNFLLKNSSLKTEVYCWFEVWCYFKYAHFAGPSCQNTELQIVCSVSSGGNTGSNGGDSSNGGDPDNGDSETGGGSNNNNDDEDAIITAPIIKLEVCEDGKIYNETSKKCECPKGMVEDSAGNCVSKCNTSKEDLKKVFPTAPDARLKEIADAINKYGKDFGIDTKEKLQHFLAQAGHESDNFKTFAEYTNYQVKTLHLNFKKHFNPYNTPTKDKTKQNPKDYEISKGSKYAKAEKLYNFVYNDKNRGKKYKLGNTFTGDGYKYRGRGIFQLTGRANYTEFNDFYQKSYDKTKNITDKPELVATDKDIAVISALWYYENKVDITIDSKTTVESVTELVNGEDNGIEDRKSKFKKAKTNIDCK